MDSSINQYAIGDLLDGRYFFIPAYQRGYRWTETQVSDLLQDLLSFFYQSNPHENDDFYCLQPIIACPLTSEEALKRIKTKVPKETLLGKGVWEIIDGQQRLTTLFLIYQYLLKEKGWDANKLKEEEDGRELYHLIYATREGSETFLDSLEGIKDDDQVIDFYFIQKAYSSISEWIKGTGKEITKRHTGSGSLESVRNALFSLLNATSESKGKSIQVLWYEIPENNETNRIKEFQKINTGKLPLTDAELIKGLFLLSKNYEVGKYGEAQKATLATEWEFIEDTLHDDAFWYFLQKKGTDMPNRIDLLFSILYKKEQIKGHSEKEWENILKDASQNLNNRNDSTLFRYYFNRLEKEDDQDTGTHPTEAWEEVMTLFRLLDDWFCTPGIYNLIGFLSQCGEDLALLVTKYESMSESSDKTAFVKFLQDRLKIYLNPKRIWSNDSSSIIVDYDDKKTVYRLLLLLNIVLLNNQEESNEGEHSFSESRKFPFELLNSQDWDIEHIDSRHTDALKSNEDKKEWVKTAIDDIKDIAEISDLLKIEHLLKSDKYDDAIKELKIIAGEEELGDEIKDSIGNLTLLDRKTNRSYGNSVFYRKRKIIIERMKQGIFVPIATQFVFAKFFDSKGTNRTKWSNQDVNEYSKFISDTLKEYL